VCERENRWRARRSHITGLLLYAILWDLISRNVSLWEASSSLGSSFEHKKHGLLLNPQMYKNRISKTTLTSALGGLYNFFLSFLSWQLRVHAAGCFSHRIWLSPRANADRSTSGLVTPARQNAFNLPIYSFHTYRVSFPCLPLLGFPLLTSYIYITQRNESKMKEGCTQTVDGW
jgi:hypothetical protein